MIGLSFFWALGTIFLSIFAYIIMPKLGWRYLVAVSALPLLIFVFLFWPCGFPESLMYLATTGQRSKLQEELVKVCH